MCKLRDSGIYEKLVRDSGSRPPLPDPGLGHDYEDSNMKKVPPNKKKTCLIRLPTIPSKWRLIEPLDSLS